MSHLLRPDGPTPTSRSSHPTRGQRNVEATSSKQMPTRRGVCPLGTSHRRRRPPLSWRLLLWVREKQQLPASRGRKLQAKSERERSHCHPDLAVPITTAGNARPQRVSPGPFHRRFSDRVAASTPPALLRVPAARSGRSERQVQGVVRPRLGPLSHPTRSPP